MSDEANCPYCGARNIELWDYDWTNREEVSTECGSCEKPVTIYRRVTVDYEINKRICSTSAPPAKEST